MIEVDSAQERAQFLSTTCGKVAAIETLLLICVKLNYLATVEVATASALCAELGKMLRQA